eukprot:m.121700 g.121700  ORF g.121700 m.121700 type:complete len:74 (-) comp28871_c0_seq5:44-265(-)
MKRSLSGSPDIYLFDVTSKNKQPTSLLLTTTINKNKVLLSKINEVEQAFTINHTRINESASNVFGDIHVRVSL